MKSKIIEYFKTDRSYKGGISLYMQFGNRISFRKQLNAQPENKDLFLMLQEELRSLAGIEYKAFHAMLRVPVKPIQKSIEQKGSSPLVLPVPVKKPALKKTGKTVAAVGVTPKTKGKK
jgi:hypothetical protein